MSRLVQMRWPDGLAERVDVVAGPRGRSGFVVRVLEEALGGRAGPLGDRPVAPAPSPRASAAQKAPAAKDVAPLKDSWAKTYGVPDPSPVPVLRRGKRPGGFVPRPKKGGA